MSLAVLRRHPRYPKARWRPVPGWEITGRLTDHANLKLVWHKTQGNGDPFSTYRRTGGIPDLTLHRDGSWDQHYTFDVFSRALRNLRGGIETNRDGVIQVEVVGFVGQEATAAQLVEIVEFMLWAHAELGIPLDWPLGRPRGSADHRNPNRSDVFDNSSGQFGHSQVGEQDHTDPNWTDNEWDTIVRGLAAGGVSIGEDDMLGNSLDDRDVWKLLNGLEDGDSHPLVGYWQELLRDARGGPYYAFRVDSVKGPLTRAGHAHFERTAYPNGDNPNEIIGAKSWAKLRTWAEQGRTTAGDTTALEAELSTLEGELENARGELANTKVERDAASEDLQAAAGKLEQIRRIAS